MSVGPTTLRLGYTNPLTGAFGAHPTLGAVLDLNDAATFTALSPDGLELSPPERSVVPAGNVRTVGERATRALYRHNRQARIGLILGPMQNYAALAQTVRTLLRWLSAPPQVPFCVQWQPPSASAPVYLDVVACGHDLPTDESQWLRLQLEPVALELWVRPGLRGDLVRLSNLLSNPGFETPMGGVGTAANPPIAFSDPFTTTGQYTQIAGGAPTLAPANSYVDVVMAQVGSSLLRYYRLGEASGASVYDIGGTAQTGTTHGGPTQGVTGLISGDTDTCYTFAAGSSQYVSCPTSGLPTGNAPFSVGVWFKFAANPGSLATIMGLGGTASKAGCNCWIDTTGKINCDLNGGTGLMTSAAAVSAGVAHFALVTWDGTTLRLYLDGVSVGTPTTPGALALTASALNLGANSGAAAFWSGQLDEALVANAALSSGQVTAIYNAGQSGASGTLANAMSVPSGATLGFGSPAWGPVQTWQMRFRWVTGLLLRMYLHRTDSSNNVFAQLFNGGNGLGLFHDVGGTLHTLAQATVSLVHEAWYWLQVTQFPAPPGDPPYMAVTLLSDDNGAVGAQVAGGQIASGTFDAVTALVGSPAINASGAALVVGGLASGAGQQVALFGPGGWVGIPSGGSVPSALAWDQSSANTAPVGTLNASGTGGPAGGVMVPVQSLGAARIDGPPSAADGWLGSWYSCSTTLGLAALQQGAIPVAAGGDTLFFSGLVRASGNGAGYRVYAQINEYNAAGAFVTSGQMTIASGAAALPWQAWNWSYTTQPTTAYVVLILCAGDSGNTSPGAVTWFDNVQCWDATATGVSATAGAMPYCELRSPNSAAQLLVSGLLGDLPAPAALAFGAYVASWPTGSVLTFAMGRAAQASSTARLVGSSYGYFGAGGAPQATAALDASSYGGFYATALMNPGWSPRPFSLAPADAPGVYHHVQRFWSGQATANIANVQARANVLQRSQAWYGQLNGSDVLWDGYGAWASPLSAGSTWTVCDAGQVQLPPQALGALTDPTQNALTPHAQWVDNTGGGGSTGQASWAALLPVDGSLLVGVVNNPANGTLAVAQQWVWAYFDGLLTNRAGASDGPAWGYSIEAGPLPNPARAGGGPGTQTTGSININSGADPYLVLDPSVTIPQTGQQGVNQLVGYLADGSASAAVLPFAAEIAYYPLYLWPR